VACQLTQSLGESASAARGNACARTLAWQREAERTVRAANHGEFDVAIRETWRPDLETTWSDGQDYGLAPIVRAMNAGIEYGLRYSLTDAVASRDVLVWRTDLINPPEDPYHCPPHAMWLLFLEKRRIRQFRYLFTERPAAQAGR
jgi:RNA polymerase sigma-70 factor (ECF subfamily)